LLICLEDNCVKVLFLLFTWHTPNWWKRELQNEFCNCTDCTKGWFYY